MMPWMETLTPLPWIVLVIGVLLALTPQWTRPDLYFAVTVRTDFAFTPQARRILHRYWVELALHTLIALCLASLAGTKTGWAVLAGVGWQLIGATWATARAHRATLQYAAAPGPLREAEIVARPQKMPGGWPLALGPLAFLAAAAIYLGLSGTSYRSRFLSIGASRAPTAGSTARRRTCSGSWRCWPPPALAFCCCPTACCTGLERFPSRASAPAANPVSGDAHCGCCSSPSTWW